MAKAQGVGKDTVQRIWAAHGLQPHRTKRFKLSKDPHFTDKLTDVVGLYLNPPDKAVVLCVDEKSQIQALQRTQPGLPMKKGRSGTMTHDYKRHGTTTPSAAISRSTALPEADTATRARLLSNMTSGAAFAQGRHALEDDRLSARIMGVLRHGWQISPETYLFPTPPKSSSV